MSGLSAMQRAAFDFVAERRIDKNNGRFRTVDLRDISEPMRQRVIDLGMMEPPLVSVNGTWIYLTGDGYKLWHATSGATPMPAKRAM